MFFRKPKFILSLCCPLILCGCIPGLPFFQKANYRIEGISDDRQTEEYLKSVLKDRLSQDLPESEDAELSKRRESYREQTIKADLQKAMQAKGYYDARIEFRDDEKELSGDYLIEPGMKYKISSIRTDPENFQPELINRNVKAGDILDAEKVLGQQQAILQKIQKNGCYFNLEVRNEVILDKVNHTGAVSYVIEAGEQGHFGPVHFTGLKSVKASYLNKMIPWKEGDCYRRGQIENFKAALLESGLFSRAEAALPEAPLEDGSVPIEMKLSERAHRTIRAGISYYTDEGLGMLLGWDHRNFFGAAEKLTTELSLSRLKQSFDIDFLKPYFLRRDQSLSLNTALRRQDTDAFEEFGFDIGSDINRKFNKYLSGSTGVALTLTRIEDKGVDEEQKTFGLISFPNSLNFDNRNDKLDPKTGWLLTAAVEPFYDALGESDPFLKSQIGASTYFDFGTSSNTVLAARVNMGNIIGGNVENIPSTERFYAGGGGSVRGFGYQEIGPKDEEGDPVGGRAFVTTSTELRFKFTKTLGGVAFVDAGSVTEEIYPDFSNMAVGAGIGARYYTSFGPLRFDIATPLTQKENLDQNYQFYISIGQAF